MWKPILCRIGAHIWRYNAGMNEAACCRCGRRRSLDDPIRVDNRRIDNLSARVSALETERQLAEPRD